MGVTPTLYSPVDQTIAVITSSRLDTHALGFVEFLRSERRVDGIDALVAQLKEDVGAARGVLGV